MTSQSVVEFLILASVVPAILGPIAYAISGPWWRLHIGRALMVSWIGVGLLVVWAAVFVLYGDSFPGRDEIRLVVFALIFVGLWYKLIALLIVRYQTWKGQFVERT